LSPTVLAFRPVKAQLRKAKLSMWRSVQVCHGEKGTGGLNDALVGGIGSLAPGKVPVKTVGSYWPYATTLFDYIRRAMPFAESKSLTDDEVYAVSAYILNLNGIVGTNDVLDAQALSKVRMPNRDGFIPFPRIQSSNR
jgi:S-disulfanyl-L-cysteine oxidoreductase SoxD